MKHPVEVNYMEIATQQNRHHDKPPGHKGGYFCTYHGQNRTHATARCKLQPCWDEDICAEWREKEWCFQDTAGKCVRGADCPFKHLSEAELEEYLKSNAHPHYDSRESELEIPEELNEEDLRKGAKSTIPRPSYQREQYFITTADQYVSPVSGKIMSDSDDSY